MPELADDGYGRVGIQLVSNVKVERRQPRNFGDAMAIAGQEWLSMTENVAGGLGKIASNFQQEAKEVHTSPPVLSFSVLALLSSPPKLKAFAVPPKVSGPIAIVKVGADVARNDASGLFQFTALVNINLVRIQGIRGEELTETLRNRRANKAG